MNYLKHISQGLLKPLIRNLSFSVAVLSLLGFAQTASAQDAEDAATVIYGFHGYSPNTDEETDLGLYTITPEGEATMVWPDDIIGVTGTYISVMWPQDGELHCLYGNKTRFFHLSFDLKTGAPREKEEISVAGQNAYKYIRRGAYNPNDGYIYGYSWNSDETQDYFVKTPASDPSQVTIIREMPQDFMACSANCFNPEDNCMYGVDVYKSLIRVDVHGNFSYTNIITPSGMNLLDVVTGLVYSPKDKCYYWNARYSNYSSEFVKIDPSKTTVIDDGGYKETYIETEHIAWFRTLDAYVSMFILDSTGSPDGPLAPEMTNFNFPDGATSGSITYKMPEKLANGEPAPASMKWEATDRANNSTSGTAAPGEEVTVNYNDLESGEYTFWFRAYSGENPGELNVMTTWIGPDVPSYPTDVTLSPTDTDGEYLVKWNPVTKGAHNAYLNTENIVYSIYLNGTTFVTSVKGTEATIKIDNSDEEKGYFVAVYAIADGKVSEAAYSPTIYIGNGWNLPYTITPTSSQVHMMTYINPENDGLGWRPFTYPVDIPTFYSGSSSEFPGNDWLITPHLRFAEKDAVYEISYDVALWNEGFPEDYYDVWLGKKATAEGIMMQEIISKTKPKSQKFERMKHQFTVPEAGAYYIGFRCLSDPNQAGIVIKNITIKQVNTGVSDVINDDFRIIGEKGRIITQGFVEAPLSIYSLDGTKIYSGDTYDGNVIPVRPGMYMAVCNGKSFKIMVR